MLSTKLLEFTWLEELFLNSATTNFATKGHVHFSITKEV